jgi:DNA polymerase III delta prime subunit
MNIPTILSRSICKLRLQRAVRGRVDHPFFADRLFANRFMEQVESLRRGTQQNKIYIFDGPPGCGKSTFLNNLLMKIRGVHQNRGGTRYESVWRLDRHLLGTAHQGRPNATAL